MKVQLYVNLLELNGEYHLDAYKTKRDAIAAEYSDWGDAWEVITRALPYGYEKLPPKN